jgi:hypothetical protein
MFRSSYAPSHGGLALRSEKHRVKEFLRIIWKFAPFALSLQQEIIEDMAQLTFNTAQYELINLLSCVNKEDDLAELKNVIVQFLNTRMQREIDKLWDAGVINDEQIEQWGKEHMRTPYKQA